MPLSAAGKNAFLQLSQRLYQIAASTENAGTAQALTFLALLAATTANTALSAQELKADPDLNAQWRTAVDAVVNSVGVIAAALVMTLSSATDATASGVQPCSAKLEGVLETSKGSPIYSKFKRIDEKVTAVSLFRRSEDFSKVENLNLIISNKVKVVIRSIGVLLDGKILAPSNSEPSELFQRWMIIFDDATVRQHLDIQGATSLSVSSSRTSSRLALQQLWSRYCGLEPSDFGLMKVYDNKPDDGFDQCDSKSDAGRTGYVSSDIGSSQTLIDCLNSGRRCFLRFDYSGWETQVVILDRDLPNWSAIKDRVYKFLDQNTCGTRVQTHNQ